MGVVMDNPWLVCSRLHNTIMSIHLKVRTQSPDYRQPSYNRPMVLLFPDENTAQEFHTHHADRVRRSCVIMKNRHSSDEIQQNLSTNVGMVLVEMPHPRENALDVLTPFELNQFQEERLLCLSVASYALFFYVLQYHLNANENLEMQGIVINPSIEFPDPDYQREIILKYLNEMFSK